MKELDPLKALNSPVNVPVPIGRTGEVFSISDVVVFRVVVKH